MDKEIKRFREELPVNASERTIHQIFEKNQ